MDGLASLMQQAPQGQPQQAPQAPMPGMNPRLDNAMEVVNNDIENLNLDPRTEYALKVQEASDLLASAERDLAMKQPQPTPPEVVDQRKQQVQQRIQQGVAGLLQQLMPGMQQRGMQMAAMQAPRGLPTQAAPNMARMMDGGIVGYKEGGEVYDDIGAMAALYKQASDKLYDPAATAQEKANAQQQIDMITAQAGNRIGQVRRRVAEMSGTMDMEMAGGGYIKGYQAGDLVASDEEAPTYQTPGGFGPILRGLGRGLAGLIKPVYEGTVGPERQIIELTRALSVLNPNSPEAERIRQQIATIRQAPTPEFTPTEDAFRFYNVGGDALIPNAALLTGDATEPLPATDTVPAPVQEITLPARQRREVTAPEPAPRRGINYDRLIAGLLAAGQGTSTAQALRGFGVGSMAEGQRQEALALEQEQADLERALRREILTEESRLARELSDAEMERLNTQYNRRMQELERELVARYGAERAGDLLDYRTELESGNNMAFNQELAQRVDARKDEIGFFNKASTRAQIEAEERALLITEYVNRAAGSESSTPDFASGSFEE